jgi:hypothetical protein
MNKWAFPGRGRIMRLLVGGAMALCLCFPVATTHAQVTSTSPDTESAQGQVPTVTISGIINDSRAGQSPMVGDVVRVQSTALDPDGDTIVQTNYRWLRGASVVGTNQTYTVTTADAGQVLTVEVSAATSASVTDPTTGVASATVTVLSSAPTASPTISGATKVGSQLTGSVGYSDADGDAAGTHTYKWYLADDAAGTANKTAIAGATVATYTVVGADQGKYLVFEVTPVSATGTPNTGAPATVVTATAVSGTAPVTQNLKLDGPEVSGYAVQADYQFVDPDGDLEGATVYNWCRLGPNPACGLGNGKSYNISAADEGHRLIVEVTPTSATGTPATGNTASFTSDEEIPYRNGGSVSAHGGTLSITVSGRSGNAPTNLLLYTYISNSDGVGYPITATLVGPSGATYPAGTLPSNSPFGTRLTPSIDASAEPANGTWTLKFIIGADHVYSVQMNDFRLFFDGDW